MQKRLKIAFVLTTAILLLTIGVGPTLAASNPVINEFVFNHTGSDTDEFMEVFGDPGTDYSAYTILEIEGDSSGAGVIDGVFPVGTTDTNGFWTTGFFGNVIENGTVTLLLVDGFSGSAGDDLDMDNDGTLDTIPWTSVVDDVAVTDGGSSDRAYSSVVLGPFFDGNPFGAGGASRIPDGLDTNAVSDWVRNDFDGAGLPSFPAATASAGEAINTPSATNVVATAPPPPPVVTIMDIQGAGHISPFVGQEVTTSGIVTALAFNGYYVQDPAGDGDDDTADGMFVLHFGHGRSVGDEVDITDTVEEDIPGGAGTGNLSTTRMSSPATTVLTTGNPLPAPVIIGSGGRVPPEVDVISADETSPPINLQDPADDAANPFDPANDGIDFYESLEGMLVTIEDPVAVSATRSFSAFSSELFTLTNNGANITPNNARTDRGGINLQPDPDNTGDQNPERVQIQFDPTISGGASVPAITVGDTLDDVTGVVGYSFGNFEVNATHQVTFTPSGLGLETTSLVGTNDRVTVASYNVLNLDPLSGDDAQRATLASHIVNNLGAPDVIALQEIQDNNGTTNDGTTDATQTLQALVNAIVAAGGPTYSFFDVAPADGASGGAPGGNIRNAYLYNDARVGLVSFVSLTPAELTAAGASDPNAFNGTRDPLAATFEFDGDQFTVINNHLSSRFGSTPVFGGPQPFVQAGEVARAAQTQALNDYVDFLLAADKDARVIVVGDLNTMEFTDELTDVLPGTLGGEKSVLKSMLGEVEDDNRYSFNFEGNSQMLDHMFATRSLLEQGEMDIVHVNVDFPRVSPAVGSDHEPLVGRFKLD